MVATFWEQLLSTNTDSSSTSDHPVIELEGWEARLGTVKRVSIPVGDGRREVSVRVPPGTTDNGLLRVRGLGMPEPDGQSPGDLYLRIRIRQQEQPPDRKLLRLLPFAIVALLIVTISTVALLDPSDESTPVSSPSVSITTTSSTTTTTFPKIPTVTQEKSTSTVLADPLDTLDVNDCLRNLGTDSSPNMTPSTCIAGTYRVLDRKYGTIDGNICRSVPKTTHNYTVEKYTIHSRGGIEVSRELNIVESYVFCMRAL